MSDYQKIYARLKEVNQTHLLEYYNELSESDRARLLKDIERIDFSLLENLKEEQKEKFDDLEPVNAASLKDIELNRARYEKEGLKLLNAGKAAAVLLAAGQGSRLGYDKPKGTFDMGLTRPVSIFELQMQNIKKVAKRTKPFPLFIMTSDINDEETKSFFLKNDYFGYPKDLIYFFVQDMAPACDFNGKIFLAEKGRVSFSPNGNGGWYSSLLTNGLERVIKERGIEWLNVYGVDNVLQQICDPVFLGATSLSGCAVSSKVVKKANAEEKTGVLCQRHGKPCIVEYYDMPENYKYMTDDDGELVFKYGVILNYLFNVKALNCAVSQKLPYHLVKKAVPHIEDGKLITPKEANGYKFETLVLDFIKLMGSCLAFEVVREKEFAPVKNKTGVDSVDTARELLKLNGVEL